MVDRAQKRILEGPLAWEVFRFGIPLAIGAILQTTFNLVDAYLIAQLPKAEVGPAIGALGVCDQLAAVGTIFSYGVSTAAATIVANHRGKGDVEAVKRTAWQSFIVVGFLSALFGVLGLFAGPIVSGVIGLKGAAADVATKYLRVILAGSGTMFMLLQVTSIQRALGSSKTPVALLVLGNVLNVVFAVLCLFGPTPPEGALGFAGGIARTFGVPAMGMPGAAWATVIARALVLVPSFFVLTRRFDVVPKPEARKPDRKEIRELMRLAWPTSAQFVLRITAMLLVNSLVARFYSTEADQTATTAMGLVFRVDSVALFVAMGWGGAAQTFVGQNLGAHQDARAKRAGLVAAAYDALMNVAFFVLLGYYGEHVLRFFGKEDAPVAIGLDYLRIVGKSYVGLGIGVVLGNAITAAKAAKTAFRVDVGVLLAFQFPVCLVAVLVLKVSLLGLFQCVAATAFAGALAYGAVYLRGHWVAEGRAHDAPPEAETDKPEPTAPEAHDEAVGEARP